MCNSFARQDHAIQPATAGNALSFKVEDMACGHCAGTITGAIQGAFKGATVTADPVSKLVSVDGVSDRAAVAEVIRNAGYTPEPAAHVLAR